MAFLVSFVRILGLKINPIPLENCYLIYQCFTCIVLLSPFQPFELGSSMIPI